ncbi:MAG: LPXTG cell wall anchor domain-containing protein [Patescibacteria group bacterium]
MKLNKKFFQADFVIGVSSLLVAFILVNKLKLATSQANPAPQKCPGGITSCTGDWEWVNEESGGASKCNKEGQFCRVNNIECKNKTTGKYCLLRKEEKCTPGVDNRCKPKKTPKPTPTVTPTITPTVTPTVTPTSTPTITPTVTPTSTPLVLGVTAPPVLPKTGGEFGVGLSLFGIAAFGVYLFRKFKLV